MKKKTPPIPFFVKFLPVIAYANFVGSVLLSFVLIARYLRMVLHSKPSGGESAYDIELAIGIAVYGALSCGILLAIEYCAQLLFHIASSQDED